MANPLVIVESPAKAKTIAALPRRPTAPRRSVVAAPDWAATVEASVGHVRDLPRNAADVPEAVQAPVGDPGHRRRERLQAALRRASKDKKDVIRKLKAELKNASELYLATDEDREGEAIAWHLLEVLNPPGLDAGQADGVPRDHAPGHPRRHREPPRHRPPPGRRPGGPPPPRPHLRLRPAGRRGPPEGRAGQHGGAGPERRAPGWWSSASASACASSARRTGISTASSPPSPADERPAPSPPPWSASTAPAWPAARTSARTARSRGGVAVLDQARATALAAELVDASFAVRSVERRPYRRRPSPPFITSTFQQEAGRKLRLSSSMAMRAAQSLYEAGYITYMRTDSTTLVGHRADRGPSRDRRALRTPVPARRAPPLRQEGQERPGGARGHPPGGRHLPLARAGGPRGQPHRRPGLRADLEAHDRLADDRCHRRDGDGAAGRVQPAAPAGPRPRPVARRRVLHQRHDHHPPGLPPGLRGRPRRGRRRRRAGAPAAAAGRGRRPRRARRSSPTATRPSRRPATPRRRWSSGSRSWASAAPRPTRRPSRPSRTASTCGRRAPRWCRRSRRSRWSTCSSSTSPTWSTTRSPPAWRTTSTRSPAAPRSSCPGWPTSTSVRPTPTGSGRGGLKEMVADRIGEIDAAAVNAIPIGLDPDGVLIVAKPGRDNSPYLIRGRRHRQHPDQPGARRAHGREGARAAGRAQGRPRARAPTRPRA